MEARRETILRAKGLRRRMSFPEVLLWRELRKKGHGLRFRRQHPIGPYVFDFYCDEAKLAVEIDGSVHHNDEAVAYDERRDAWLRRHGVRVLRLSARLVFEDMDSALLTIVGAANFRSQRRPPPPRRLRGAVPLPLARPAAESG